MVTHMPQFNSIPPSGIHPGTRAHHLVARQVGGTTYYYYYYNYYYALLRTTTQASPPRARGRLLISQVEWAIRCLLIGKIESITGRKHSVGF